MATETLYATSHLAGDFANPDNANGNTPLTWAGTLNANSNYTSRWAIGDPVDPLTASATQTIEVVAKKGTNSGVPTIALNLYENGTLVGAILAATNVTSLVGQTLTGTFNTSAVTNRADVEIEVVQTSAGGSPTVRNSAQISLIRWVADVTAAAPEVNIAPDDTTHAHAADSTSLTQTHQLVLQDATHGHTADSAALTQTHLVAVDGTSHAHTVDAPALTQTHLLTLQDTSHSHTAGNVTLDLALTVTPDATSHGHTAGNVTLTQTHLLTVDDAAHTHTADTTTVTQTHLLALDGTSHSHTADNVTVTAGASGVTVTPDGTVHVHTADAAVLTQTHLLAPADTAHAHTAAGVTVTQTHVLTVDGTTHTHTAGNATVTVQGATIPARSAVRVEPRGKSTVVRAVKADVVATHAPAAVSTSTVNGA